MRDLSRFKGHLILQYAEDLRHITIINS